MLGKKKLSVCMITYNNETEIKKSLRCMGKIVDEVFVVDIGSTDQTREVAEKLGASVYLYEWKDSFSEVKNFAMEHATGKWILFLQPYEVIEEEEWDRMYDMLENPNVEAYLLFPNYGLEEYVVYSPVSSLRLIRNRKEYRFCYQSFERIPDESLRNIEEADLHVTNINTSEIPWDLQLRMRLLEEEVKVQESDGYIQYMYGIMRLNAQEFEESLAYLKKAYGLIDLEYLFAPHLYKCLALDYMIAEQYEPALEVLKEGITFFAFYTDLLVLRAEVYRETGCYELALEDLKTCMDSRERPYFFVPGPEIDLDTIAGALASLEQEM